MANITGLAKALNLLFGGIKPITKSLINDNNETYVSERFLIMNDNVRINIIVDTKLSAMDSNALQHMNSAQLNELLDLAIKNEDYTKAAEINKVIEDLTRDEES